MQKKSVLCKKISMLIFACIFLAKDMMIFPEIKRIGNHRIFGSRGFTIGPYPLYICGLFVFVLLLTFLILELFSGKFIFQIFFLIFIKIEFYLIFSVSFVEPGIVPRRVGDGPPIKTDSGAPTTNPDGGDWGGGAIINGIEINRKWCYTCNIYRPSRGKHCAICNCCVDKYDHHCVWLSNCIGSRNYRNFVALLGNTFLIALFVFVKLCISGDDGMWRHWLVAVISLLIVLISGNLFIYHFRLILRGSTSYESVRGTGAPFSLGDWRVNLTAFVSAQVDPSRVAFDTPVTGTGVYRRAPQRGARDSELINLSLTESGVEDGEFGA